MPPPPKLVVSSGAAGETKEVSGFLKWFKPPTFLGTEIEPGGDDPIKIQTKVAGPGGKAKNVPSTVEFLIFGSSVVELPEDTSGALATVPATFEENVATGEWSAPGDGTYPESVVAFVRSEGPELKPKRSKPVDVADAWIVSATWDQGSALLGDDVGMTADLNVPENTQVAELAEGQEVTFKVFWQFDDFQRVELEDVTAALDADLNAHASYRLPTPDELKKKMEDEGLECDPTPEDGDDGEAGPPDPLQPKIYTFCFELQAEELREESLLHASEPAFYLSL